MDSKTSAEILAPPGTKAGSMRRPEQGNVLWQLYHHLTRFEQRELKERVEQAGFWWSTFTQDTRKNRLISLIPFMRLDLYRSFFQQKGQTDLFELARKEQIPTERAVA